MQLAQSGFKILLLVIILFIIAIIFRERRRVTIPFSGLWFLTDYKSKRSLLKYLTDLLRILGIIFLVIALARPQRVEKGLYSHIEGVDIVLVLDRSGSMISEDFKPKNRLDTAKNVISEFIDKRQNDRIGLVIFARNSYLQAPLTLDHAIIKKVLDKVEIAQGEEDGTAIGMGLMNGINRLKNSNAKSKIIILLTDGVNNAGAVDPQTAAKVAEAYNIKIYTIGVGTEGYAPVPFYHPIFGKVYQNVKVEIDEEILTKISEITRGVFYRATNPQRLRQIYNEIDKLEKSKYEQKITNYKEEYFVFAFIGLLFLFVEILLRNTLFLEIF
ncbi:MAG: VWA domain-containing protein [Candidatus Hydrogenedentota bacterium]